MIKTGIDDLDSYCEGVSSGDIAVCRWVRSAVDRHYKDLERQGTDGFPYEFEPKAAIHFFDYLEDHLCHYEGVMKGRPLKLEPWQKFVYGSIFGWLKVKDFQGVRIRRFRNAIIIVPKKNGKSILSGSVGLYMMDGDNWPAAQCYILAKNQTHAKDLGYRAATIMVDNSPSLSGDYRINKSAANAGIYFDGNNSFYKPITSKPESEDGRNVHFCGPDETKDWTDFEIYEVMKNGTVNAPNSLFMSTTTAGPNKDSLGYHQQKYLEDVLSGKAEDETTFGVIYGIDPEDKTDKAGNIIDDWWLDKKMWAKANPNYNVSVFEDALVALAQEAKSSPSKRNAFETKHLNIWHSANESFIPEEKWQKCGKKKNIYPMQGLEFMEQYRGMSAWGGLDLGAVSDFTGFVLVMENNDVIPFFWIPEDTIGDRKNAHIIKPWIGKWVGTTPGDWTDHDYTEQCIKDIASIVRLEEITYDRYKMDQMVTHLQDEGIEMTPFGQGYVSMAPAVDHLENAVLKEGIEHFGNPVLAWMNTNVVIRKDPAGNRKFDKDKSQDKIDGMVALAMALFRSSVEENQSFEGELFVV